MDRADEIWESIRYVNDQLEQATDSGERQRLLDQKNTLQLQARALATAGISTFELETELTEAKRRWLALQHERIDHVKHAGGGDFSGDVRAGADVIYMNKRIDEAQGRAELEARIATLRRMIDERHSPSTDPQG